MILLKLALELAAVFAISVGLFVGAVTICSGILTRRHEAGRYVASRKQLRAWRAERKRAGWSR